jgi:hypothetical protein
LTPTVVSLVFLCYPEIFPGPLSILLCRVRTGK